MESKYKEGLEKLNAAKKVIGEKDYKKAAFLLEDSIKKFDEAISTAKFNVLI